MNETVSAEAFEQLPTVEVDEMTATTDSPIASEDPTSEPSSRVAVVQSLINLEEEPMATDVEEELETAVNPTIV